MFRFIFFIDLRFLKLKEVTRRYLKKNCERYICKVIDDIYPTRTKDPQK